ncbi:MAG: leucyl/phenylalanyl-tRNA--protein transferase [Sterolibacterium sp.]|nr:leucyl/phenylalanyl-tRNA--protein transferase [Sterolibacterium sp.]
MIPLLLRDEPFPPVAQALREPNGLLCAGADLSVARLLAAYQRGIFPWYSAGEPLLWWSPDPRMVLFPDEFKISRSLAKTLRNAHYEVRLDTQFAQVMSECAAPRRQQAGTWISREMQTAYTQLHELGHAHSVEVWIDDKLAGGLYGVALGRVFYGESMFSHQRDTSKIALAHLCRFLEQQGFVMIDCQMKTAHLASLGAREISRSQFLARLAEAVSGNSLADSGRWPQAAAQPLYRQTGHFLTT